MQLQLLKSMSTHLLHQESVSQWYSCRQVASAYPYLPSLLAMMVTIMHLLALLLWMGNSQVQAPVQQQTQTRQVQQRLMVPVARALGRCQRRYRSTMSVAWTLSHTRVRRLLLS
jgi:hypothetical protein